MTPHWKNKPRVSAFIKFIFFFSFSFLLNQLKIVWLMLNRLMRIELNYQFSENGDTSYFRKKKKNIAKPCNGSEEYLVFLNQPRNEMLGKSRDQDQRNKESLWHFYLLFWLFYCFKISIHLLNIGTIWGFFFPTTAAFYSLVVTRNMLSSCRLLLHVERNTQLWASCTAAMGKGRRRRPPPPSLPLRAVYFWAKPVSTWQPQIRYDWPR